MSDFYAGLWMFAWDLAAEGVDKVMGWAAESGLTALQIASSYHAGWFLHPHNPQHRAFMPEDGCVYFHPQTDLYQSLKLKPKVARACRDTDWMREAGQRLEKFGLKLVAWTVCCHNTRLGLARPECTVKNCYGDSYPHALCPSNDHVRSYLAALCKDLANNLPLEAIQLESPGYMGLVHGHHHERDLTGLSSWEVALMDLCFCASCVKKAGARDIDVLKIRAEARSLLDASFAAAPDRPKDHPQTAAAVAERIPQLTLFQQFRRETEDTLVREIRLAMQPSACKLALFGGYNKALADLVEIYCGSVYGLRPDAAQAATKRLRATFPAGAVLRVPDLYMGVRLGGGSVFSADDLAAILRACRDGGATGAMFYNYSESPMTCLNWIRPALAAARR